MPIKILSFFYCEVGVFQGNCRKSILRIELGYFSFLFLFWEASQGFQISQFSWLCLYIMYTFHSINQITIHQKLRAISLWFFENLFELIRFSLWRSSPDLSIEFPILDCGVFPYTKVHISLQVLGRGFPSESDCRTVLGIVLVSGFVTGWRGSYQIVPALEFK